MRNILKTLACCAAFFVATAYAEMPRVSGEPAWGNEKTIAEKRVRHAGYGDAETVKLRFAPMAEDRVSAVRARNALSKSKPLQIGINRETSLEAEAGLRQPKLNWVALGDGGQVARFAVESPGASALRVGLNVDDIPAGAELRFLGAADRETAVAMVGSDEIKRLRREQPIYWTPVTEGDRQIVEIYLPNGAAVNLLRFSIESVAHLIVSPYGKLDGAKIGESQSCEVDVKCVAQTTGFVNAKNAVARMVFQSAGFSFLCTGTLLNDQDANTQIPYFYGAHHCISSQTEASTLSTFWFYESTGCNSGILGTAATQVAGGATLLYNESARDALLLRLTNAPPAGAFFSGWDPNPITVGTSLSVIHHPVGDLKKVSLGQVKGFTTLTNLGGNFITVGYTNASTEAGSSGAGLLTLSANEYFLRGGLQGGSASCSNFGNLNNAGNDDYFSRFDQVYPSISQYLAPSLDYSGAWSNTSESGWGLSVIRGVNTGLYGIIMYHYNQSANPTWYFMSAGSFSGNTYSAPITQYSGPYFGGPFNPALVTSPVVGSATINFTSATTATISYSISGAGVSNKSISKLLF